MNIPHGTICHACKYFYFNDATGAIDTRCLVANNGDVWKYPSDFTIDGIVYDVPMVTECTKFHRCGKRKYAK